MKGKYKSLFLATAVSILFTGQTQARTYGGENVVVNDLEWVRWDVTVGWSPNEALNRFNDYRVATDEEIAGLFEHYMPSVDEYSWSETLSSERVKYPSLYFAHPNVAVNSSDEFLKDFGYSETRCAKGTSGLGCSEYQLIYAFHHATDGEGNIKGFGDAPVVGWYDDPPKEPSHLGAIIYSDGEDSNPSGPSTGVALVRTRVDSNGLVDTHYWRKSASSVPEIDTVGAGLALALLGGIVSIQRERRLAK